MYGEIYLLLITINLLMLFNIYAYLITFSTEYLSQERAWYERRWGEYSACF